MKIDYIRQGASGSTQTNKPHTGISALSMENALL